MRFFFNAPSKSSQSGRAKILMNFIEFHCIFDDILPKFDRLVLGCINEFLNFLFDLAQNFCVEVGSENREKRSTV